ncbi:SWI/SNF complex component SNF12-like [Vitis vinifera]|uniref:SWI/SNF complex component SNF12-like n=1 Tax=Vitis vinifera TaxID=29760 RepID=A0A438K9G5_VITVI|nr:SWI/SNF complex component SNF12-like [Vitis vinifera]
MVPQKISHHLSPPQPIHLEHKVKLSGNSPAGTTCYDVLVDVPLPLEKEMSAFLANTERHKEIDAYDETICASIKKIQEHNRRRAFFLGDASRNAEKERRADFYNQPWVDDAVIRYLNRKPAPGMEAHE